ncbi:gas vesicle protein GvpJ [Halovivax sp.]|uniref:gas vesicle protein GvpJ n=1 Tax=Halovivax sp. TaxID=1935978 RepID=UPI0025BD2E3C|nr:gas vesicle protein GvpJ [Halovivax sp.]
MNEFQPSRRKSDLADVVEMLLDKGVVINADIAVSIGDTQLLGIQVRAAIASFETAAKYGLEFPEGTDMRRVAEAVDEPELAEQERPRPPIDATRGVNVTEIAEVSDVERCLALTGSGDRCSREAGDDGFCFQHDQSDETVSDPDVLAQEVQIAEGGAGGGDGSGDDRAADGSGDDGLFGGDDRGTERLGARPDPNVPTDDGFDMIGDDREEGSAIGEQFPDDASGDDEPDGETTESDAGDDE